MTRRQMLGAMAAAPIAAQGKPPNVLLLMTDQHKPRALGIDGDPVARTPNLDALAAGSCRFDSAYCSNPVCTPSRASLLTGLYTHNHGAINNTTPWPFEIETAAHHFHRAGYMTALVGKMHFVDAQTHGFDYRLDFNDWYQYLGPKTKLYAEELSRANSGSGMPQIDDLWRDFGDPWKDVRELDNREGFVHVGRVSRIPERDHFDSFVARESVRFLRNHGRRPFFLISSFLKPHDPFMPSERFAAMFRASDMKLPATFGKVNLSKVPRQIRESIENNRPTPELRNADAARLRIALYYANLAQVDDCIGQVLRALSELQLDRDTIVIYTTDHGEMLGEHGLWQKFVFYEASVGVPLIFRVPGVTTPGSRCPTHISQVDVLPTLAELCRFNVPKLDGRSAVDRLKEPALKTNPTVFAEFALRTPSAKYMVRYGEWKYCHYVSDTPELYNLRTDPEEMNNLAAEDRHREQLGDMRKRLFDWYTPPERPRDSR